MKLSYDKLLCPLPIQLSIGSIYNHKLIEIAKIGFDQFNLYEMFLKITPQFYYTELKGEEGKKFWNTLSDEKKRDISMFSMLLEDESLQKLYLDIFNFFFVENVYFKEGMFVILKDGYEMTDQLTIDAVRGAIFDEKNFSHVLYILQQICCIANEEEEEKEPPKYKNKLAQKMHERMKKAERAQKEHEAKKSEVDMHIANIISKVSNNHPSINPINVWDLTLFQLLDSFKCIQFTKAYDITSLRCAVWGDKEKTFDTALWYHNQYDKKDSAE